MIVSTLISQLKKGHEFCGICGKDVTNQPDCVHNRCPRGYNTSNYGSLPANRNLHLICEKYSTRVGMEMLMYVDELKYLPMFDKRAVEISQLQDRREGRYECK